MKFKTFTLILFTTIMISSIYCDDQVDKNEPTVSIHAEDTHLPTILSMLAKQSDYNIVTGPNVQTQEKLTIHLDDVPISQAINLIIRASGLSYEIIGNSILVANKSKLDKDIGVKPHVISLQYANAAAVSELLKDITPSVQIDFSGNNLLVTASPKKINEIEAIVKDIDTPAVQIMLEARLIEVSLKDEAEMGIDWEKLASTSIIFAEGGAPRFMGRDSNGEDMWFTPYPGMSPQIMTDENAGLKWLDIEGSALPSGALPEGMLFTQDLEKIQPL